MPRLTFPSAADQLVYAVTGNDQPILAKPGLSVRFYTDAACTTVADIRTTAGGAITNSALTVDSNSLIPLFLGPDATPPVDTLYVRPTSLSTGTGFPIYAREDDRLDNKVDKAGGDTITITDAAVRGLVIRGATGQTANLSEWQNSAGTVVSKVNAGGGMFVGSGAQGHDDFAWISVAIGSAIAKGVVVRGTSGQSGSLVELQTNDGAPAFTVDAFGRTVVNTGKSAGFNTNTINMSLAVSTVNSGSIGLVVRGAGGQAANLQEWQNSAGTVLARVDPSGTATFSYLIMSQQNNTGEGGELVLQGSTGSAGATSPASPDVILDNVSGGFRIHGGVGVKLTVTDQGHVAARRGYEGGVAPSYLGGQGLFANATLALAGIASGSPVIVARGAAGQTNNLVEVQNSDGVFRSGIDHEGRLATNHADSVTPSTVVGRISVRVNGVIRHLMLYA